MRFREACDSRPRRLADTAGGGASLGVLRVRRTRVSRCCVSDAGVLTRPRNIPRVNSLASQQGGAAQNMARMRAGSSDLDESTATALTFTGKRELGWCSPPIDQRHDQRARQPPSRLSGNGLAGAALNVGSSLRTARNENSVAPDFRSKCTTPAIQDRNVIAGQVQGGCEVDRPDCRHMYESKELCASWSAAAMASITTKSQATGSGASAERTAQFPTAKLDSSYHNEGHPA